MERLIGAERRIRATAAVEGVIGLGGMVQTVVMIGPDVVKTGGGIGAMVAPIVVGCVMIVGGIYLLAARLAWSFRPTGRWLIALSLAAPAWFAGFGFVRYTVDFIADDYRYGHPEIVRHLWAGAIEVCVVTWTLMALIALFGPGSGRVFSADYRAAFAGDRVPATRCLASAYFVAGVMLWGVVAAGFLQQ